MTRLTEDEIVSIAEVTHEANAAYCRSLGDVTQSPWEAAPKWQRDSAIAGVKFHLDRIEKNLPEDPEASHNNWMKQKLDEGWKYGSTKLPEKKEHHCLVSFEKLPLEQQRKDVLFENVVRALVWKAS